MTDREKIRQLEKELALLKEKQRDSAPDDTNAIDKSKTYFDYLTAIVKQNKFGAGSVRVYKFFRGYLSASRIFRYALIILSYLHASAFFIISAALLAAIIPFAVFACGLILICVLLCRAHAARMLCAKLKASVRVISLSRDKDFERFSQTENNNETLIIISPFFFSARGVGKSRRFYFCFRRERDNIFIVRKYFYFYFNRKILRRIDGVEYDFYLWGDGDA